MNISNIFAKNNFMWYLFKNFSNCYQIRYIMIYHFDEKNIHLIYFDIFRYITCVNCWFLYNKKLCIVQEQNWQFINVDYLKYFVHKVEIRLASKLFIVEIIILIFGTKCPRCFQFLKWMRKLWISRYWRVSRIPWCQ